MRLILFDIDGTLIDAHRAGHACLTRAMEAVFGTAGPQAKYDWRGKTDPQIVQDLLRAAGVPDATIRSRLDDCFAVYGRHLEGLLGSGHPVDVLPGVRELIEALSPRADCLVGLLTGNVAVGAHLKLSPTGLLPAFRVAATGSDDMDRRRLPAVARERAETLLGRPLSPDRLTIVGDTPLDIDCARAAGAAAVAVATGQHTAEELAAHAPDHLFADLGDTASALAALLPA
jgi:phosphoglycolate phosphatase-like HAD superfamily hydrolase